MTWWATALRTRLLAGAISWVGAAMIQHPRERARRRIELLLRQLPRHDRQDVLDALERAVRDEVQGELTTHLMGLRDRVQRQADVGIALEPYRDGAQHAYDFAATLVKTYPYPERLR